MNRRFLPLLGAAFLVATSASAGLLVSAAASLSDVLPEVAKVWLEQGGEKITFNFAASSALASQVEAGAPVDVLVTADEESLGRLERGGLLLAGTKRALVGNRLAVIVPNGSKIQLTRAAELVNPGVRRLTLADPAAVPAGKYAKAWLERLGVWSAVEKRVVPTLNVRAALAAVAAGEADAGVVYVTDVAASATVRIAFSVPASEAPPIVYPVAVVAGSKSPGAARDLVKFLESPAARAIFDRFGFERPPA